MGLLTLYWILYFTLHSLLAAKSVKNKIYKTFPSSKKYYRLFYNLIAIALLYPILAQVFKSDTEVLWRFPTTIVFLAGAIQLIALGAFIWSFRYYDMKDFLGLKLKNTQTKQPLVFSPFHKWVRHPWYFFALVILWFREMTQMEMLSTVLITIYFIVGSYLEEKKLLEDYGAEYGEYLKKVPGLIPLPWKRAVD